MLYHHQHWLNDKRKLFGSTVQPPTLAGTMSKKERKFPLKLMKAEWRVSREQIMEQGPPSA